MKRRHAFQTVTVFLLIGTALLALGPVRQFISRRVSQLRETALGQIERALGREVTYQSISPSILNYLSVRGLTVHGEGGDQDLLRVDRLRLYYRPLRLLQGRFEDAFSEIRIVNSDVFVDARLSERLESSFLDGIAQSSFGGVSRLPEELLVSARNLDVEIATEQESFAVVDLFFDAELAESILQLRANGNVVATSVDVGVPLRDVAGAFELSGTVDLEAGTTLTELQILSVESSLFALSDLTLQIRLDEGRLEVRNVQSREPLDLFYRYDDEDDASYARILVDGFQLASIVRFRGALMPLNELLAYPIRGQANVASTPDSTAYGISLSSRVSRTGAIPPGTVTVQLSGDERAAQIDELAFRGPEGRVTYTGRVDLNPVRPRGRLIVEQLSLAQTEPFSTTVSFESSTERVSISATPFDLNGVPIGLLMAEVDHGASPSARMQMRFGFEPPASLGVRVDFVEGWSMRAAEVSVDGADVADLVAMQGALFPGTDPEPLQLFGNGEIALRGSADFAPELVVRLREFTISDRDDAAEYFSLRGAYRADEIEIDAVRFSAFGVDGRGSLAGSITGERVDGRGELIVEGVEYGFDVAYQPDRILSVIGDRNASLLARFANDGNTLFETSAEIPLPSVGTTAADLAFQANGRFAGRGDWQATLSQFEITGHSTDALRDIGVSFTASVDQGGAVLENVSYTDQISSLQGSGEAQWDLERATAAFQVSFENVRFPQGEWYILSGAVEGSAIDVELLARGSPIERFGVTAFTGGINTTLAVQGTLQDPRLSGDVRLINGRFNNDPVNFSAVIAADRRTATIEQASGQFARTSIESLSAGVSLASDRVALEATLTQNRDRGALSIDLAAQGIYDGLNGFGDLITNDLDAEVVISGVPAIDGLSRSDWVFSVAREDGRTNIAGGPGDSIDVALTPDGSFEATVGGPLPVSLSALGYLSSGRLEMDLINVRVDIERFGPLFDDAEFAIESGVAEGSLRVVGPLNDPDFYGTLVARGVVGRVDLVPVRLGPARVFLVFEEKVLTVRETRIAADAAAADVGAQLVFDRWGVEQYQVTIRTIGEEPLPVDSVFGEVQVRGDGSGWIELRGDRGNLSVFGRITASSTTIAIGEEEPDDGDSRQDTTIDLTIESGRGVEFLWPNENVPILRGFADAGETVSIAVQSETGSFGVDGTVGIQGGEIFYFDRSFYITEGEIIFAEDQNDFDPRLSVNAEIREISEEGPVRIYLVAEEKPLSEFSPRWRSDPPLSETDILALLGGTVFVGESGEPIDFSQAVLLTSDFVSQFGLIRNFERSVRDALQLDLFSIRTQLFQNLLRGVIDQNAAVPLDTTVPSLGQYLDNTTLFAGRYLGNDLFLELLVQVSETEPQAGTQRTLTGIEVDSEVSLEWETPFFQLEWAFFPRNPDTLFLTDNTIRFSWDFSY